MEKESQKYRKEMLEMERKIILLVREHSIILRKYYDAVEEKIKMMKLTKYRVHSHVYELIPNDKSLPNLTEEDAVYLQKDVDELIAQLNNDQ